MIIIQCRADSKRWPGKWKADVDGVPMLRRVIDVCLQTNIRPIVVTTPDREIADFSEGMGIEIIDVDALICDESHRNDLVMRYLQTMTIYDEERCLRITADCPYHFPQEIEWIWRQGQGVDFCTNGWPKGRTTPDGVDCETYSYRLLLWMSEHVKGTQDREHLPANIYMWEKDYLNAGFSIKRLNWPVNMSKVKFSLDTPEDLARMKKDGLI